MRIIKSKNLVNLLNGYIDYVDLLQSEVEEIENFIESPIRIDYETVVVQTTLKNKVKLDKKPFNFDRIYSYLHILKMEYEKHKYILLKNKDLKRLRKRIALIEYNISLMQRYLFNSALQILDYGWESNNINAGKLQREIIARYKSKLSFLFQSL